ncbi:hypothetical protein OIO90_000587 [Microbotryomycetes sp. JL221]|nr:hypothetical protein OIO90_000587 [Microbotryomycetes sp. JL221]
MLALHGFAETVVETKFKFVSRIVRTIMGLESESGWKFYDDQLRAGEQSWATVREATRRELKGKSFPWYTQAKELLGKDFATGAHRRFWGGPRHPQSPAAVSSEPANLSDNEDSDIEISPQTDSAPMSRVSSSSSAKRSNAEVASAAGQKRFKANTTIASSRNEVSDDTKKFQQEILRALREHNAISHARIRSLSDTFDIAPRHRSPTEVFAQALTDYYQHCNCFDAAEFMRLLNFSRRCPDSEAIETFLIVSSMAYLQGQDELRSDLYSELLDALQAYELGASRFQAQAASYGARPAQGYAQPVTQEREVRHVQWTLPATGAGALSSLSNGAQF